MQIKSINLILTLCYLETVSFLLSAEFVQCTQKAPVDFTSRHDVEYSGDLATVSKRRFIEFLTHFCTLLKYSIEI